MAEVKGGDAIRRRLRLISKNVVSFIGAEMDDIAQEILEESRRNAPQLTGRMIATAGWDKEDFADAFRRSVFYREDYAVFQHEGFFNPGPITATKPNAGRKFLQRAYTARVRGLPARIGRAVERSLRVSLR